MYPYLRLFRVVIQSSFKKKQNLLYEESKIKLRVFPQDIDPFMELNNGRYVTLLDLGRFGYGANVKISKFLKEHKWSLTIVGTYNEYRFRLRLFQKFTLKTKIIGYDEKWFYFFQKAERNNKTHMASVVKFAFTSKKGIVFPKEVIKAMGEEYNPDKLPSWITEIGKHELFKK